jgi:hypothetical protein
VLDPRPEWVDPSKVHIPQADELQHLLANLVLHMNRDRTPLPRWWFLPSGFQAAVVMTGDDHAGGGTAGRFLAQRDASVPGCSVEDWGCLRSTSYVYPTTAAIALDAALARAAEGFEVALHVNTGCLNYTSFAQLDALLGQQLASFAETFPGVPAPRTNRNHCIVWSDYETVPQVELAHGIRLDTSYYYWPDFWVNDRPGFMTGSGLPMRYADRTGRTIDVYQAATQLTDESNQTYPATIETLLDNVLARGFYGVFTANMHTDQVASPGSDAIVSAAQARGVPVVSAMQLLRWLDGRNGSSFGDLTYAGGVLGFTVTLGEGARNIEAMLPVNGPGGAVLASVSHEGAPVPTRVETIKGVPYAFFAASEGAYEATYQ